MGLFELVLYVLNFEVGFVTFGLFLLGLLLCVVLLALLLGKIVTVGGMLCLMIVFVL